MPSTTAPTVSSRRCSSPTAYHGGARPPVRRRPRRHTPPAGGIATSTRRRRSRPGRRTAPVPRATPTGTYDATSYTYNKRASALAGHRQRRQRLQNGFTMKAALDIGRGHRHGRRPRRDEAGQERREAQRGRGQGHGRVQKQFGRRPTSPAAWANTPVASTTAAR